MRADEYQKRLSAAFTEVGPEHLTALGNAMRAKRRADLLEVLERGRANAISVATLARRLASNDPLKNWGKQPGLSTLRADIRQLQEWGIEILTSPRAGVWLAADQGERLDVLEELRASITAIGKRMQLINAGRCALRSCRAELPKKVTRRGGLYCNPRHRYQAAVERKA